MTNIISNLEILRVHIKSGVSKTCHGTVVKVEDGFTKASFKKMVKKYLNTNR